MKRLSAFCVLLLSAALPASAASSDRLDVGTLIGQKAKLMKGISPDTTIEQIKEIVYQRKNWYPPQQIVTFGGWRAPDGYTVRDCCYTIIKQRMHNVPATGIPIHVALDATVELSPPSFYIAMKSMKEEEGKAAVETGLHLLLIETRGMTRWDDLEGRLSEKTGVPREQIKLSIPDKLKAFDGGIRPVLSSSDIHNIEVIGSNLEKYDSSYVPGGENKWAPLGLDPSLLGKDKSPHQARQVLIALIVLAFIGGVVFSYLAYQIRSSLISRKARKK